MNDMITCDCGSGLKREPSYDGHMIFLFYACPECIDKKMSGYRPDIMSNYECDEPIEPEDY